MANSTVNVRLPALILHDGTVEALKWLALLFMTLDHLNRWFFHDNYPWMYHVGRVAMPLFVFILAYNLSRPQMLERGVYQRTMRRLFIFGILATPAFIALQGTWLLALFNHHWWLGIFPLNILFSLGILTATLFLLQQPGKKNAMFAALLLLCGGGLVEYHWFALIFGIAIWYYRKAPTPLHLLMVLFTSVGLSYINYYNPWPLIALLLIVIGTQITLPVPRLKWLFYVYYPLHLTLLWGAQLLAL